MSTTPRTDEVTYPADCLGKTLVVHRDFAAALEVELKEAEQEDNAANHYLSRAEKAEAKANIMREALKLIANYDYRGNRLHESQIAFRALEASK
jgi:hypothetical protein